MEFIGLGISLLVLLLLLALGVPVTFCVLAASVTSFVVFLPPAQIGVIGSVLWGSIATSVLAAVPLFVLMGEVFARSGLSDRAYRGLSGVFDRIPGGMLHTNVAACSVFAAASGTSIGTMVAIGRSALPQLHARDYPRELSYGTLLAGGTLGILIPPSLAFIIFGVLTGTSIADLFMAGLIPGLALAGLFSLTVAVLAVTRYKSRMPRPEKPSFGQTLRGLVGVVPLLGVVVIVLGSIYFGIATATEAGAVGALAMLLLALRSVVSDRSMFVESLLRTVSLTGMILTILMSSALLSYVVTISGMGRRIQNAVVEFGEGGTVLLFVVLAVVMLLMGMFLDPVSVLALVLPVVFPVSQALDVDPLWLAVFMVVNLEMGLLTPPVGLNLFVLKSVDPTSTWPQLLRGSVPFLAAMAGFLVLLALVPGLATWLPALLNG